MSRQRSLIFWPVLLRKDRDHSWKHHCRSGLTRELLGWIDVMASKKEAEKGIRFVFAKRETLLTKCFKGKRSEGKHYKLRQLDYSLAELREQHIISEYRETTDGSVGFVVAPHDSLCHREKSGKTCLLPDRSIQLLAPELPVSNWRNKVLDALKSAAPVQSLVQHECSDHCSASAVISAAVPAIDCSEKCSERCSDQSLYDANFALLSESEKADWLANGMQGGASTRVTRLPEAPAHPINPIYPSDQDELKHHEHFLKSKQRQNQDQPQKQKLEVSVTFLEEGPNTAEATPKATQPGRKRDVLAPLAYDRSLLERSLAEEKAEIDRARSENGYQRCADEIWRPEADRIARGWTIFGEGAVWYQDPVVAARLKAEEAEKKAAEKAREDAYKKLQAEIAAVEQAKKAE